MLLEFLVPFLCAILGLTHALELKGTQEGSCSAIRNIPTPPQEVDPIWLDSLPYVVAGNKFHLYRQASVSPRFRDMREYEFYYDACYVKNTSLIEGNGSLFGFGGRVLGSFDVELSKDPNALIDAIPNNPQTGPRSDFFRQRVTLTDSRTFAVMVHCWVGADQKSWNVYSLLPELSKETVTQIENHIEALGFKRENFIFLQYENCKNLEVPRNTQRPPARRGGNKYGSEPNRGAHGKGNDRWGQGSTKPNLANLGAQQGYGNIHGGSRPGSGSSHTGSIKRGIPSGGATTLRNLVDTRTIGQSGSGSSSSGRGWGSP